MIESRLDPLLDDTGGGYGRYPGLTVVEVAERFRFLVEEGQGRSARAILRIAREQTLARGNVGSQRWVVAFFAAAAAVLFAARFVVAPETRARVTVDAAACAGLALLFAVGTATVHRAARRGEAQVREIRRLALISLDGLVSRKGFEATPLDREHVAALRELRRVDPPAWRKIADALGADGA